MSKKRGVIAITAVQGPRVKVAVKVYDGHGSIYFMQRSEPGQDLKKYVNFDSDDDRLAHNGVISTKLDELFRGVDEEEMTEYMNTYHLRRAQGCSFPSFAKVAVIQADFGLWSQEVATCRLSKLLDATPICPTANLFSNGMTGTYRFHGKPELRRSGIGIRKS